MPVKGEGEPWNERVIIEASLAESRGRVSGPSGRLSLESHPQLLTTGLKP